MSSAFRCDRCKKFYDRNEEDDEVKRTGFKGNKIYGMAITDRYKNILEHFDLCPECVRALDIFMNDSDIEKSEVENENI